MAKIDFGAVDKIPDCGVEFFKIFSRFEYAMKEAGYFTLKGKRTGKDGCDCKVAEANWKDLLNELGARWLDEVKEAEICPTLISKPPRYHGAVTKCERPDRPEWIEAAPIASDDDLQHALKRVRNNLFHGGKYCDPDSERHRVLITEARDLLVWLLGKNKELRLKFEER